MTALILSKMVVTYVVAHITCEFHTASDKGARPRNNVDRFVLEGVQASLGA